MSGASAETISYRPTARAARIFLAKKLSAFLLYAGTGVFVLWLVGPGLASERSPNLEYWSTLAVVGAVIVILVFLFVVTWNERLARIENGRMTWPFPFMKKSGVRTRYISLEEIAKAEVSVNSVGPRVANLTLLDGTHLVLPDKVFGEKGPEILEALERQVKGRPIGDGGDAHRDL